LVKIQCDITSLATKFEAEIGMASKFEGKMNLKKDKRLLNGRNVN